MQCGNPEGKPGMSMLLPRNTRTGWLTYLVLFLYFL